MTNSFYTPTGVPQTSSQGTSAVVRNEFDLIATGFDKMPALTGNANKAVVIDPTGAFMTVTTGTLTLTGNLTVSNNLTFTGTNGSSVNFGGGGTVLYSGGAGFVSSITGTANEIAASAATGDVTLSLPAALTFTGKTVTGGTFTGGAFNGTVGATTPTTGAFTTLSTTGALTYGGVTLSNSVTGTGSMALSASPTFTGTTNFANQTVSGAISFGSTVNGDYINSGLHQINVALNNVGVGTFTSTGFQGAIGASTPSTGAFTTGAFSGVVTLTSNNGEPLRLNGATTGPNVVSLTNSGGQAYFGQENSTGNNIIVGSTGYDTIIRGPSGISFSANAGASLSARITSTGINSTNIGATTPGTGVFSTVGIGGSTASFPGLQRSGAIMQVVTADGGGFTTLQAGAISGTTLTATSNVVYLGSGSASIQQSGNYTMIYTSNTVAVLQCGNASDPTNYYSNTNHSFRNAAGTATYATIGSGFISSGTASTTQGSLILHNTTANSVTLKSSNSTSAAYTLTLPVDDGTSGQVLSTDGSGVTSWITASGAEYGTWTPGISFGGGSTGITYTFQSGTYVKSGRSVYYCYSFATSSKGSSTGNAKITGCPYTSNTGLTQYSNSNMVGGGSGVTLTAANVLTVSTYSTGSATTLDVGQVKENAWTPISDASWSNSSSIYGSITVTTTT